MSQVKFFLPSLEVYPVSPECFVDQDCSSPLACIDQHCQNLCETRNPCTGNLQCSVIDTGGKRVAACACPDGYEVTRDNDCKQGNK